MSVSVRLDVVIANKGYVTSFIDLIDFKTMLSYISSLKILIFAFGCPSAFFHTSFRKVLY